MMRALSTIVVNGFRESVRNRVSAVAAAFTVLLLLGSTLVTEVTVYTMVRVLTDFGLGTMSLTLTLLAIFLSTSQLVREIERKTIFLIVSKPISRGTFVLGKFGGTLLTLTVLLAVMGAVFLLQLLLYGAPIPSSTLAAIGMIVPELMVVCAVGVLISSFAGQVVSAVVTTGVFLAGHLGGDIYTLSQRSDDMAIRVLGKATYSLLPNLDRLNLRPLAAYGLEVPWGETAQSVLYAVGYTTVLLSLAVWIFSRRDFR